MKYFMYPVVSADDLARELKFHYDIDMDGCELSTFLYGDGYVNDCYKSFYYGEMEEFTGKSWQNEESIRVMNCIKSILQDIISDYDTVLIDVGW